jgi:hypothetical protein
MSAAVDEPRTVAPEVFAGIHERIVAGRMLDAWELARGTGVMLKEWPAGEARRTAARVAAVLGADSLSQVLNWLNWRAAREDPLMVFHGLYSRISRTPEWLLIPEVEGFLGRHAGMPGARRADLLAFLASMRAALRDFGPAHEDIARALDLGGDDPWVHVVHALVLEKSDRYGEALEAARRAVALRPRYGSAVLQCAENLIHLETVAGTRCAGASTSAAGGAVHPPAFDDLRAGHAFLAGGVLGAQARAPRDRGGDLPRRHAVAQGAELGPGAGVFDARVPVDAGVPDRGDRPRGAVHVDDASGDERAFAGVHRV